MNFKNTYRYDSGDMGSRKMSLERSTYTNCISCDILTAESLPSSPKLFRPPNYNCLWLTMLLDWLNASDRVFSCLYELELLIFLMKSWHIRLLLILKFTFLLFSFNPYFGGSGFVFDCRVRTFSGRHLLLFFLCLFIMLFHVLPRLLEGLLFYILLATTY